MHYFAINGNKSDDKKVTDYRNVNNLTPTFFEHISSNMFGGGSVMPTLLVQAKPWVVQAPGSKAPGSSK